MSNQTNFILSEMRKLYIMFCLPQITENIKTGEIALDYVWKNEDAEKLYNYYSKIYAEQNKHELLKAISYTL